MSLFKATQDAAAEALLSDQTCVQVQNDRYEKDETLGLLHAKRLAGTSVRQRAVFAWLKVPEGYTSETFSDVLLEKHMLLLHRGMALVLTVKATSESVFNK